MTKPKLAAQSRAHLDERFQELGPATRYTPPVRGWIKAVREALGMTTAQLAKRLGSSSLPSSPSSNPKRRAPSSWRPCGAWPRRSTARSSMRSCPTSRWRPPSATARALFARRRRGPVEHSMLLEDQKVTAKDAEARLDEIVRETNPRLFWD